MNSPLEPSGSILKSDLNSDEQIRMFKLRICMSTFALMADANAVHSARFKAPACTEEYFLQSCC